MAHKLFQVVVRVEVDDPEDGDEMDTIMEDLEQGIEDHVEAGEGSLMVMGVKEQPANERL